MPRVHNFLSKLVGSFATPAAENPTVAMIEAAFAHHGIDARYINCEVAPADLGDAVRGAKAMGWLGFNCSIPHKVAVIAHLDSLGQSAATIGAVNCVVRRGERLIGENTDGKGFVESLRTLVDPGTRNWCCSAPAARRAPSRLNRRWPARAITVVNRGAARGRELVGADQRQDAGQRRARRVGQDLSRARGRRHPRQRHLDRALPGRRRPARARYCEPRAAR